MRKWFFVIMLAVLSLTACDDTPEKALEDISAAIERRDYYAFEERVSPTVFAGVRPDILTYAFETGSSRAGRLEALRGMSIDTAEYRAFNDYVVEVAVQSRSVYMKTPKQIKLLLIRKDNADYRLRQLRADTFIEAAEEARKNILKELAVAAQDKFKTKHIGELTYTPGKENFATGTVKIKFRPGVKSAEVILMIEDDIGVAAVRYADSQDRILCDDSSYVDSCGYGDAYASIGTAISSMSVERVTVEGDEPQDIVDSGLRERVVNYGGKIIAVVDEVKYETGVVWRWKLPDGDY